jgi:hypothetical protein
LIVVLNYEFVLLKKNKFFIGNKKKRIMSWEMQLDDKLLEDLYKWIDSLPLTRPKKRIDRDFSDGKYYFLFQNINSSFY